MFNTIQTMSFIASKFNAIKVNTGAVYTITGITHANIGNGFEKVLLLRDYNTGGVYERSLSDCQDLEFGVFVKPTIKQYHKNPDKYKLISYRLKGSASLYRVKPDERKDFVLPEKTTSLYCFDTENDSFESIEKLLDKKMGKDKWR